MSSATDRDRPHGSTPSNENTPGPNRRRIHRQIEYKDSAKRVQDKMKSRRICIFSCRAAALSYQKINNFSYTHPIFPLFNHRVINPSIVNMSRRITYALHSGKGGCCSTIVLPV